MRRMTIAALAVLMTISPAMAFHRIDESVYGLRGSKEWKQYRGSNCKVERKWEHSGEYEYKEEIKCDGPPWARGYAAPPVVMDRHWMNPTNALPPLPQGPTYGTIYQDERGLYCREYRTFGVIDGRRQRLYGTACLQSDGSWSFNN
jgi:hypothetical protein